MDKNEENLRIDVSEEFYLLNKNLGDLISPNEILILKAVYEKNKEMYLDIIKKYKSEFYFKESIEWLILKNYLKNTNESKYIISFENLECCVSALIETFNFLEIELIPAEEQSEEFNDFFEANDKLANEKKFIVEWYDLWPIGVRSGNYLVRSGIKPVTTKMLKFKKEHKHLSDEIIYKATEDYIKRFKLKNYAFIKTASYFIYKDGESVLEAECEKYLSNLEKQHSSILKDNPSQADDSKLL